MDCFLGIRFWFVIFYTGSLMYFKYEKSNQLTFKLYTFKLNHAQHHPNINKAFDHRSSFEDYVDIDGQ